VTDAPRQVRIAVGLWLATAVFVLFTSIGLWFQRGEIERLSGRPSGDVTNFLVALSIVAVILAALYGWLTRLFLKRRNWARIALSLVAIGHMLWLLVVGVSAANLVTLLLICVAIVFTWQRATAQWLAEVREP
jgi:Na+/melibiose symporter-like transporter